MPFRVDRRLLPLLAALAACESRDADERTGFNFDPPAQPASSSVLRADTNPAASGTRWMDLDVLMGARTEAEARATLQKVIDSIAAADTMAVVVRATGFVLGPMDPESQTADVLPAMRALWGPPDSVPKVGVLRRRYRTQFLLLRRFDTTETSP
ncbi:MAG TPA: hypothetical protein VFH97_09030 [Gemmatimonadales bacterium]|nr:hypothetical protein [Gemmatimonadales bacterium]